MSAIWAVLLGLFGALVGAAFGDLFSEEVRARLGRVPAGIIRLAGRRLPADVQQAWTGEWLDELEYILRGAEAMPVTRLVRGTSFAISLFARGAPAIRRESTGRAPRERPPTRPAADASTLASFVPVLRKTELFRDVDEPVLLEIARRSSILDVSNSQPIFTQNEPSDAMFVLAKGTVRLVVHSADGRQIELARHTEPAVFGEFSLLDDSPRSASAEAVGPSRLLVLG